MTAVLALLALFEVCVTRPATADEIPHEFAVGIPQDSGLALTQERYLFQEVISLRSGATVNNYLAFTYFRVEPFEVPSAPFLTQLFRISGNTFVPVLDKVEAQRVLSTGLKVGLFEKDIWEPGKAIDLSPSDYLIGPTECNFLSSRLKLPETATEDSRPWYLLRLSSQSQFSDGVATWPCKSLEGRIAAWTKVAALEPAVYKVNNSYLLVDRSSPFAVFVDSNESKCVIQYKKDKRGDQVILHLFSNKVLAEVFNAPLLSEADVDAFRSTISSQFGVLFSEFVERYHCVSVDNDRGQSALLTPDHLTYTFPPQPKGSLSPPPQ